MDESDSPAAEVLRRTFRIPASVICLCTIVFQAYVLNHYLVTYYNKWWLLWIIPDTIVTLCFLVSFIVSIFYLQKKKMKSFKFKSKLGGELPLAYISWFIYSVLLSARVAIIFWHFAYTLDEKDFFGPNMLRTDIALASVIFFLLVLTHADTVPNSPRDSYINLVIGRVTLDVLDTVSLLEVLFFLESRIVLSFELHKTIIAIACINLILPTVPLVILSKTQYGKGTVPKILDTLHITLYLVAVNLPSLVVRLVLWHVHEQNVSVFLIKNILSIGLTVKKIHDHIIEIQHEDVDGATKDPNHEGHDIELQLKDGQPTTELVLWEALKPYWVPETTISTPTRDVQATEHFQV